MAAAAVGRAVSGWSTWRAFGVLAAGLAVGAALMVAGAVVDAPGLVVGSVLVIFVGWLCWHAWRHSA